jgi:negative regulator of flagellin synthesis FlgM
MVDPIGARTVATGDRRTASVEPSVAPAQAVAPRPAVDAENGAETSSAAIATVARTLAATPPVDTDRVARIRSAIARGTYPIVPETIADRLIALKLDWNPHDPS